MKILGIGNALVDMSYTINDDALLRHFSLQKGSVAWVSESCSQNINRYLYNHPKIITAGGSAANTLYIYSSLGGKASFLAKIGRDEYANMFCQDLRKVRVEVYESYGEKGTGVANTLISKDGERTFATCLGAAEELIESDLKDYMFEDVDWLYLEGYLMCCEDFMEKIARKVKSMGIKIAIDLSSPSVVHRFKDYIKNIVDQYANLVFANEQEAIELTQCANLKIALSQLSEKCDIAVVKMGSKGSLISAYNQQYRVDAIPTTNVVDTSGAGDAYAAGFLYGMSQNLPWDICGTMGSKLASSIISNIGARFAEGIEPKSLLREIE